jgi:hypothetical protein
MLKGIMSISGQPGLYKMVAEAKNRIIVESLTTGKRIPVSTTAKISSLEEIAIYTQSGDISLKEVLKSISEKELGNLLPDPKGSNQDIRSFFEKVLPEYDQERVYVSDIRKILIWYSILQENNLLDFSEDETDREESPAPAEGEAQSE